eukprot:6212832-Pleurochrysis_carterae.AAC.5
MRATSLRTLASIAARQGYLSMRRWDFVAAYLQGDLEPGEAVYCRPPPGCTRPSALTVRRAYARSSSRFTGWLRRAAADSGRCSHGSRCGGFRQSDVDHCVFVCNK